MYQKRGDKVFGASRKNGYDFFDSKTVHSFLNEIEDYDVLINNAPGIFQSEMFLLAHKMWAGKKKVILNVGSRTTQFPVSKAMQYGAEKAHLDFLTRSAQHFGSEYPYTLLIRPGYFGGERSYNKDAVKVNPMHVAELIQMMVDNVENYRILDLVVNK